MKKENAAENKHYSIDVFGSQEIDMMQTRPKKQRKIDDYDYNDPFFEPFEGETDAVDVECKLENFYVYKGSLEDDAKKVAKKYNKILKRPVDRCTEGPGGLPEGKNFNFEVEYSDIPKSANYKKDDKFQQAINAYLAARSGTAEENYLKYEMLKDSEKCRDKLGPPEKVEREVLETYRDTLRMKVRGEFEFIQAVVEDSNNYRKDGGHVFFELNSNEEFLGRAMEFIVIYMMFYKIAPNENMNKRRNLAYEYLKCLFSDTCTNRLSLKRNLIDLYDGADKSEDDSEKKKKTGDKKESTGKDSGASSVDNAITLETINTTELNDTEASKSK